LWRHISDREGPPQEAWKQHLDAWQQEISWDGIEHRRQETVLWRHELDDMIGRQPSRP